MQTSAMPASMRSLAFKLTLAFLAVGIIAVALVAGLISFRTESEISRLVYDRNVVALTDVLANHYARSGSWDDAGMIFERGHATATTPATQFDWRQYSVALLANDGQVIYGRGEFTAGQDLPARTVQRTLPIKVDGKVVGRLLVSSTGDAGIGDAGIVASRRGERVPADSPEASLLKRLGNVILVSTLGAIAVALLLAALLARSLTKPIRELTAATAAVAEGKLGAQVPVRSEDELGQLAASFNHMSNDLARSTAARRQMTADVAHDLRTPLSLLLGYTEALQDGKLQGDRTNYAVMHDAAQQLQRLVEDLNTLALADAGELPLMRRPADPKALLERSALTFMPRAEAQGVTLSVEAADDLPDVNVDTDRFTQVLNNLVANALRYTPAGGRITLFAENAGGASTVLLRVSDTGRGISPEDLPHIFDRSYRGDTARQTQNGEAGLGLAIARSIVESHGGAIEVSSTPDVGTTFTIRL